MVEKMIERLITFGFTQYEAKVYVGLVSVKVGSARDIHELTAIPRGRVYDVLETLVQKGYAAVTRGTPTLYSATDVHETFDRLKQDYVKMCNEIVATLVQLEQKETARASIAQSYELHTTWALENQIRSVFRRCHNEIVVLCSSPAITKKYESELKSLAKRVRFYLVVDDPKKFAGVPMKIYTGDQDVTAIFLAGGTREGDIERLPELLIFSDEKETLSVVRSGDTYGGIMVTNGIFGKYMQKSILRHLHAA